MLSSQWEKVSQAHPVCLGSLVDQQPYSDLIQSLGTSSHSLSVGKVTTLPG